MPGFNERYEVSCGGCGVIAYYKSFDAALKGADTYALAHADCDGVLLIYDRMAHEGKENLFYTDGTPATV